MQITVIGFLLTTSTAAHAQDNSTHAQLCRLTEKMETLTRRNQQQIDALTVGTPPSRARAGRRFDG